VQNIPRVDHVIDGVYISGARAYYSIAELRAAGVTHVLQLYFDTPNWPTEWPDDFVIFKNPLPDGEPIEAETLHRGVSFINEQVDAGRSVLVMCGAGISRSSTFVLAYLLERGFNVHDAWQLLRERHPSANPLPQLLLSLVEHYNLAPQLNSITPVQHEIRITYDNRDQN
jgi:protein-tyrosine phosphatase